MKIGRIIKSTQIHYIGRYKQPSLYTWQCPHCDHKEVGYSDEIRGFRATHMQKHYDETEIELREVKSFVVKRTEEEVQS